MSSLVFLSPVDMAMGAGAAGIVNQSGSQTCGVGMAATEEGHDCTGARGYLAGGATSLKVSLWRSTDSVRVATVTIAVSGAGVWTATFGSAFPLVAGIPYVITVWDTSAGNYTSFNITTSGSGPLGNVLPPVSSGVNAVAGQYVEYCPYPSLSVYSNYAAGDAVPSSDSVSLGFPIEPTVT